MYIFVLILLSYFIGAIPFGFLLGKTRGIDIRNAGSGNIGATNVMRVVGKPWGIFTLVLDACKGFVPAAFFPLLAGEGAPALLGLLCGVAAIVGHSFPVYLRFRGGKGVATSAGVLVGVTPAAFGVGIAVFLVLFGIFRYVSLGSIGAALAVPIASFFLHDSREVTIVLAVLAVVVIWRHKDNIRRLLSGTENRVGRAKRRPSTTGEGSSDS